MLLKFRSDGVCFSNCSGRKLCIKRSMLNEIICRSKKMWFAYFVFPVAAQVWKLIENVAFEWRIIKWNFNSLLLSHLERLSNQSAHRAVNHSIYVKSCKHVLCLTHIVFLSTSFLLHLWDLLVAPGWLVTGMLKAGEIAGKGERTDQLRAFSLVPCWGTTSSHCTCNSFGSFLTEMGGSWQRSALADWLFSTCCRSNITRIQAFPFWSS